MFFTYWCSGSKERILKEARTRHGQRQAPDELLPSARFPLPPPHNAMILCIHWRTDPFVRSEPSWSGCLWRCLRRVKKKCTSSVSCISHPVKLRMRFNHHGSVGKVERIWKMVVLDGKYLLLINVVAKYFFFLKKPSYVAQDGLDFLIPLLQMPQGWDYKPLPPHLPIKHFL